MINRQRKATQSSSCNAAAATRYTSIMYNLLVIFLLILNVHVMTPTSALCNKTPDRQARSSSTSPTTTTITTTTTSSPASSQYEQLQYHSLNSSSSSSSLYDTTTATTTTTTTTHLSTTDQMNLDELRLEYYKYKIVSHLDLSTDPDKFEPNIEDKAKISLEQSRSAAKFNNAVINSRQKRSLACSEVKSDRNACCLETFYVNFTEIGWDKWILYPTGYNANYCRGQCDLSHARYYHSTLLSKFSSMIGLCCSPKQMAPLRLLYIDETNKVLQKTVPDMIVESCDCA